MTVSQRAQAAPLEAEEMIAVHFTGSQESLDDFTVDSIHGQLLALADEPNLSELRLDFGNVQFVSSMDLDTLLTLHKKLLASGRHLSIYNLTPHVHEFFAVTTLDQLLDLRPAGLEGDSMPDSFQDGSPRGVLVVDDEEVVRALLEVVLHSRGFEVWVAAHGFQAIELYRRHREQIGIVLLDVLMPGIDGPHTLAALKQLSPTVRCCFMTGNPAPYTEETLLHLGAVRVFRKPFVFTEVINTLNDLASCSPRQQDRWIEIPCQGV